MKVKIIRGIVCVAHTISFNKDERCEESEKLCSRLERRVNDFCKDKEIISVTPTVYTTRRHNNGGNDELEMIYTILYKEAENNQQQNNAKGGK